MKKLQINNSKYEKIKLFFLSFLAIFLFAFSILSFLVAGYKVCQNDLKQINQTQNISDSEINKKSINKKLAQTQHVIVDNTHHTLIGEMGSVTPYSVYADTFITFEFNVNEDTLGDYHFSYITLEKIQLNVHFWRYNHINTETEFIGQIASAYFDVKNRVGADVEYWFNLVEYYEFHANFSSLDNGKSNEADISFDFYAYDTAGEEIIYTFNDTTQFQFSSPFYVRYSFGLFSENYIFDWINLFVSQEIFDFYYNKGFSEGEALGRENGYREGFNAASGTTSTDNAFTFIWSTISNATNSVLNVFDRQILPGIPLYVFIMIPVIISILFFVLKVVKK